MKKTNLFRKWSGIAALALLSAGCVDSDDPSFSVNAFGYVLQRGSSYAPYMSVTANEVIKTAEAKSSAGPIFIDRVMNLNVYETSEYMMSFNPTVPNGNYQFTATNEKGESASVTLALSVSTDKPMGAISLTKFEIDNCRISMETPEVENATNYFLMVCPGVRASENAQPQFLRCNAAFCAWSSGVAKPASGEVNLSDLVAANFRYTLTSSDVVYIAFVAARQEQGGTVVQQYPTTPVAVTINTQQDLLNNGPVVPQQ